MSLSQSPLSQAKGHFFTLQGRASPDYSRIWVRGRLPLGRHESDRDAGLLALLFTAAGQEFYAARHEAAGVYGSLGWTSPVSLERALWHQAQDSLCVLSDLAPGARDATRIAGALLAR